MRVRVYSITDGVVSFCHKRKIYKVSLIIFTPI